MRKPMLQAVAMAGVTFAGFWAAQHGLEMPNVPGVSAPHQPGRSWVWLGLAAAAMGAWFGLRAGIIAWMRKGLIDSEEVLARWTVSPGEWVALTGKRPPAADTPVIIDRDAVVVGDSCTPIPAGFSLLTYTQLSSVDWVENGPGLGGTLVLARMFWNLNQSYITFVRAPVPEAARGEAQAAIDALDPLISDYNREKAERRFGSELADARSSDPDAATSLLARRLLGWGAWTAIFGGVAWWVATLPSSSGQEASWWIMPFGMVAVGIGIVLLLISFVMIFLTSR
jgi:hypothetical protein